MRSSLLSFAADLLASHVLLPALGSEHAALQRQVMAAERAFAKTMADRDHAVFAAVQLDLAAGAVRRVAGGVRQGKPGLPSSAGAVSLTSRRPGAPA